MKKTIVVIVAVWSVILVIGAHMVYGGYDDSVGPVGLKGSHSNVFFVSQKVLATDCNNRIPVVRRAALKNTRSVKAALSFTYISTEQYADTLEHADKNRAKVERNHPGNDIPDVKIE